MQLNWIVWFCSVIWRPFLLVPFFMVSDTHTHTHAIYWKIECKVFRFNSVDFNLPSSSPFNFVAEKIQSVCMCTSPYIYGSKVACFLSEIFHSHEDCAYVYRCTNMYHTQCIDIFDADINYSLWKYSKVP